MDNEYIHTGPDAIDFLCDYFSAVEIGKEFKITVTLKNSNSAPSEKSANITIAGFNEARRKELGRLDDITSKNGSVFIYGDNPPDFFLVIKSGGKTNALSLENAAVQPAGFADSLLRITSPKWPRIAAIEIRIRPVINGKNSADYFEKTVLPNIRSGIYLMHIGKWVSKKVYDRSLSREVTDRMSIEEALRTPDKEVLKTMVFGSDIKGFEFNRGDMAKKIPHILRVKQQHNTLKLDFVEFIIEPGVMGREIGAKQTVTTYIYLIGTSFQAPANLLVIRHV